MGAAGVAVADAEESATAADVGAERESEGRIGVSGDTGLKATGTADESECTAIGSNKTEPRLRPRPDSADAGVAVGAELRAELGAVLATSSVGWTTANGTTTVMGTAGISIAEGTSIVALLLLEASDAGAVVAGTTMVATGALLTGITGTTDASTYGGGDLASALVKEEDGMTGEIGDIGTKAEL